MRSFQITAAAVATMALCALALAGCRRVDQPATSPSGQKQTPPRETWTHELTQDEAWYEHPAQGRPPDGTMLKGTKVRVLNPAGSYTEVLSDDGVRGYVSSASLRAL
jgi:hypothetical protein